MYIRKKFIVCILIAIIGTIAYKINQIEIAIYVLSFLGLAYFYSIKHPKMGSFFAFIFTIYLVLNVTVIDEKTYDISLGIAEFINKYIPIVGKINESNSMAFLLLLVMILCCIISPVFSFLKKRNLPMGMSENISKEFINDYLKQDICDEMTKKIDRFDKEYNWLDRYFVPLKADVEIKRKGKNQKKVVDLLSALKKCHQSNRPIYLLIGEPGSGKSVALRKLCRELLEEVDESGKIPLYINLKEWTNLSSHLQEGDMPKQEHLVEFILDFLGNGATYSLERELEDDFLSYIQKGRWFFIFDSFDEIPCLLSLQEPELVIEHLSRLLYQFLLQHNCGGIVASRPYRSPSVSFNTKVTLNIRPMDEDKIYKFFSRYTKNSKRLLKDIYHQKTELINLLRNPFYASLILNYYNHQKKLPSNQTEMFDDFINIRLDSCSKKIKKAKLTKKDVITTACKMANCMFECESGLEISTDILKKKLNQIFWIDDVIDILCSAKICQLSQGGEARVTFVHRRFQEYFLVLYFITYTNSRESFYTDIERNTRLHDALILYCEIINDEEAEKIAQHCWEIIKKNGDNYDNIRNRNTLYAVNCMQFLKEAFINRRNCIQGFIKDFQKLIDQVLDMKTDVVFLAKVAECICLFESKRLDWLLLKIFTKKYSWVNEIALKSCVGFCKLNKRIEYCCYTYIGSLKDKEFLKKYWNFKFIFSTYKSYRIINIYMRLKMFDIIVTWLAYICIIALIFSGNILVVYDVFIENKMLLLLCITFATTSLLMDIIKYVLPKMIVILCLASLFLESWYYAIVFLAIPIHFVLKYLRTGYIVDDDLHETSKQLEKKNIEIIKNLLYIGVASIVAFYMPQIEKFYVIVGVVFGIVLLIYVLKGFFNIVFDIINRFKYKGYRNLRVEKKMERRVLEKDLQKIRSEKEQAAYIEYLIENQVSLSGEWSNPVRPDLGNKNASRLLAVLDIKDLNIKF